MSKRRVEIVVISDVHLGTFGCHANELLQYLNSIEPGILVLNGDIIEIWQFRKSYWPKSHMLVIRKILEFLSQGIPVFYLTGNHDEMLRRFSGLRLGKLEIKDKLILELGGKKAWFFHGDVFDVTMKHSKWLAKLGAIGYDLLILLNRMVNWFLMRIGRSRISLSKKIKDGVKSAVKFMHDFESVAADLAIDSKYSYVVCGHIHQPNMRVYQNAKGSVLYLNSGDWVENLTSLEFFQGEWSIYRHDVTNHTSMDLRNSFKDASIEALFDEGCGEEAMRLSTLLQPANTPFV